MIHILDNFYNNPEFVSSLGEFQQGGCGGVFSERSKPLDQINKQFHNDFSESICSVLNLNSKKVDIYSFLSRQTYNGKNTTGFIHIDGRDSTTGQIPMFNQYRNLYGGTIFLSEEYDRSSGINFYDDITEESPEDKFYCGLNSLYNVKNHDQFDTLKEKYNSRFEITTCVSNVYNRLVVWKCGKLHASVITEKQKTILTHNFYISIL